MKIVSQKIMQEFLTAAAVGTLNRFSMVDPETGKNVIIDVKGYGFAFMPIVSAQNFERLTGVKITEMSGKLNGLRAITTAASNNSTCIEKCANCTENSICKYCYVSSVYKIHQNAKIRHEQNTVLLSEVLPVLPAFKPGEFIRLNSHGELTGMINALNYVWIALANPSTNFSLWTKCPEFMESALEQVRLYCPDNLTIIYSSPTINVAENLQALRARFPRCNIQKVFTCYDDPALIPDDAFKCVCCTGACDPKNGICGVCYLNRADVVNVAELVRK